MRSHGVLGNVNKIRNQMQTLTDKVEPVQQKETDMCALVAHRYEVQ